MAVVVEVFPSIVGRHNASDIMVGTDQRDSNSSDEVQSKRREMTVEADEWLSNDLQIDPIIDEGRTYVAQVTFETGITVKFCDGVAQTSLARPDEPGDDIDVEEVGVAFGMFVPYFVHGGTQD